MTVRQLSPVEASELLDGDAVLIDVREEGEWSAGHAPMATFLPLADVPDHLDELPRDRLVICVCRSGVRSLRAARFLVEQGFDAANLDGGMVAWMASDLPLESDGDDEPYVS